MSSPDSGTPPRVFVILEEIKASVSNVREQLIEIRADQRRYDADTTRHDARLAKVEADVTSLKEIHLRAQGAVTMGRVVWAAIAALASLMAYLGWRIGKG